MYRDILDIIKNGNSIFCYNLNKKNYASHIMHLLLSSYSLYNIAIIDHENQIGFLNRNFKINPSVNMYGYHDSSEILDVIKEAQNKTSQQLLIYSNPKNYRMIGTLQSYFDYTIKVINKHDYEIIKNKRYNMINAQ